MTHASIALPTCQLLRQLRCALGALALLLLAAGGATHRFMGSANTERSAKLVRLAGEGNIADVQRMIDAGMPVEATNITGATALMAAALNGRNETLHFLLKNKANAAARERFGHTALMLAAKNGNMENISLLLRAAEKTGTATATINASNQHGATALTFAAIHGHTDIARALLDAGARPTIRDRFGVLPLQRAERAGHTEIAPLLRETENNGK